MATLGDRDRDSAIIAKSGRNHEKLDDEIARVRSQILSLTKRRSLVTASLYATRSTQALLRQPKVSVSQSRDPSTRDDASTNVATIRDRAAERARHRQQCLYRMGAGATMFEVKDPDPYAVGNGRVLGVRMEVFVSGQYLPPYYLLLNRPDSGSSRLRIHKHTVPAFIPLAALAARYLCQSSEQDLESPKPVPKQQLGRLVRELRRELVSYHLRAASIASLRDIYSVSTGGGRHGIDDVSDEGADARNIRLEWIDGRIGRIRVNKDGLVTRCVVFGETGRRRDIETLVLAGTRRIDDLDDRLRGVERM